MILIGIGIVKSRKVNTQSDFALAGRSLTPWILVGTMLAVSQKKISIDDFNNLLSNPKKDAKIFKAPGKGLVLKEVFYEN